MSLSLNKSFWQASLGASIDDMIFISKQTVTGTPSSIDFTSGIDSTYQTYMFLLEGISNDSTLDGSQSVLQLDVSTDGGASYGINAYSATSSNYSIAGGQALSYLGALDSVNSTNPVSLSGYGESGDTGYNNSGTVHLYNPSSSTLTKYAVGRISYKNSGGVGDLLSAARFDYSSDIDAVKFKLSTGNFTAGSITLYGLKTS
jgi:hypothetical protein